MRVKLKKLRKRFASVAYTAMDGGPGIVIDVAGVWVDEGTYILCEGGDNDEDRWVEVE